MVSKQLVIGFAVGLTSAAFFTVLVFFLLVQYDRRKKARSSRAVSSLGERHRPEGTSHDSPFRSEMGRDHGAFEHSDRPLQQRDQATPFSTLSHGHMPMDQSSLTGTGNHLHTVGRPTLAFGAPSRLQSGRPVDYSDGRVNSGWENNRPWSERSITPRYHTRGMRTDIPRPTYLHSHSQSNETRSVEGYLNNNNMIFGLSRSYNDSGYSDTVIRPPPLGGDAPSEDTEHSSSNSGSVIPAFMNSQQNYPIRLHRQDLGIHDEGNEDSYF